MKVDIDTRLITLIGTPLSQSFAARMHNAGYAAAGCNMFYFYSEVGSEHLAEVINAVRCIPAFAGCAVTKPHKVEVMRCLDDFDPLCKKTGSCNTVVKDDAGRLIGYNTDGYGALRSLKEQLGEVEGKVMFSFGAGGVGRSVCFGLAEAGAGRIYVCAPCADCEELCADLDRCYPGVSLPLRLSDEAGVAKALAESEVILNLSGAGMRGRENETCMDQKHFRPGHVCFDATYNPGETRFLREARESGCRTINGLDMSLYQGLRQIELWTGGRCSPLEAMRRELADILAEQG